MLNKAPLISVAMATYDGSPYLTQQLESIFNQTYKNIELIIVDDCSRDNTIQIIQQFQQRYPSITLMQNPVNAGVVKSFEKAIGMCNGEYIALADQDDIWYLNKLQVLIENINDNLLIHSDATLIDQGGTVIAHSHFAAAKTCNKATFVDYLISNNVTGCTCLFPRQLVKLALPFPKYFYSHDHYLALVASFHGKIKLIDEPLVYYRQHANNVIGAARPKVSQFFIECKKKADSYSALLNLDAFRANQQIELLRDYRLSIYHKKWCSKFNLFRLLTFKGGYKLIIYYFLLVCMPYTIAEKAYDFYVKCKYKPTVNK